MAKTKTHFEQVPIALVKQIIAQQLEAPNAFLVPCRICGTPVGLDLCKIDEHGNAVHERCYIAGLSKSLSANRESPSNDRV
ncbi:MAG TPA: hypothetical protein VHW45_08065 [Candidatus Sulfotelmatobacter sp.]|jgi:hypothetical protein|nr:hypothetical protein [Candidatus Sulfotelmatobacter sp.]